jgi:hypothetical protein
VHLTRRPAFEFFHVAMRFGITRTRAFTLGSAAAVDAQLVARFDWNKGAAEPFSIAAWRNTFARFVSPG